MKTKCGFNADAMLFYVTVARIVPRYEEYILMDTHTHTHRNILLLYKKWYCLSKKH